VSDDEIKTKLINIRKTLEGLRTRERCIGFLFGDRTEDGIFDVQRRIAEIQSILDRRMSSKLH
jgi:hypothetical protein